MPGTENFEKQKINTFSFVFDWNGAFVTPLFKKGDKTKASANYRPVSLTSICSKAMEHIIHSSNMASERDGRVNPSSSGQRIGKRQQIDTILQDFSKVFDKAAISALPSSSITTEKTVMTGLKLFTTYHILYTPPTRNAMPFQCFQPTVLRMRKK